MHGAGRMAHRQGYVRHDQSRRIEYRAGCPFAGPHAPGQVALYLDDRSTQEQRDALIKIFAGQAGGYLANLAPCIGEVLGVKAVHIDYKAGGRHRTMAVNGLAEVEIEARGPR